MHSVVKCGFVALSFSCASIAVAQEPPKPQAIIVNTSGGENAPMLRAAYFNDFEAETGIKVIDTSPADFGRLQAMVKSGNVEWDITEIEAEDAGRAVELGLLEPIDEKIVDRSSFNEETKNLYHYPPSIYSTVIGYSTDVFPNGGPKNWADFWDIKRFPGPRAMSATPLDNLEAALLADGVEPAKLYPLDVDRAFKKMDEIYPNVAVWWTSGAQQAQSLIDGEAVMTTAWNGRLYAAIRKSAPIAMEYGGGILKVGSYGIPKGAKNPYWSQRLLAVMTRPKNEAKYSEVFGYSGPNPAHIDYVSPEIKPLLPLAPENAAKQVWMDQKWWVDNGKAVTDRWTKWMLSKG